jgi:hypothetical protein
VAKNLRITIADSTGNKKYQTFFALKTLNENDVEVENQPSRPAYNQHAFVSSGGDDSNFTQCFQWFS